MHNVKVLDTLWNIIEEALKELQAANQANRVAKSNNNQAKRPAADQPNDQQLKKVKSQPETSEEETVSPLTQLVQNVLEEAKRNEDKVDLIKLTKKLLQVSPEQKIKIKKLKKYAKKVQPQSRYAEMEVADFYEKLLSKLRSKSYYQFSEDSIVFQSID